MIDFTDIDKNLPNGENMGGLTQKIWFGYWVDVATWPTKPDYNNSDIEDSVELTGDITMKAGKRMFEMYITDDTGELKMELVGEVDGHSYVEHLSLFHPGLQSKIRGFMRAAQNENLVFIVEDSDGQRYLMGDAVRPAILLGSPDGAGTGKTTAARKGVSLEFTYKTTAIYSYAGNIPVTEASA